MIRDAISQTLSEGLNPHEHGFVDRVREILNDNEVDYPPMSFDDLIPHLN